MIAPEASGWFRRTFTTPEDLAGLKMNASGLGGKVLNKLGVETHTLQEADILIALESGEIDGAEFSMPSIDVKLGFYQLADHYYFPGWHQPSSFFELIINKDRWDALTKTRQAQIKAVCGDNVRYGLAEGEALQYSALKELTAKGVKIKRWPAAILSALEDAWKDVALEQSSANTKFREVWHSLSDFRKDYAIWRELARP
jgi:TRAP-type mannitol/chloroaromatic compound transport system substrate-binding protein